MRDDLAAARAGARAEIENVIGGADRFLIVLDDDDGIPEVAQSAERGEQARVIALMQSDARLVENIKNAGQARTDLRGEPDPLRFAAGKRPAFAIEGEIIRARPRPEIAAANRSRARLRPRSAAAARSRPAAGYTRGRVDRQLAELMDVQLAAFGSLIVTARISGFKRAPWQVWQGTRVMKARMRLRVNSLSVSCVKPLHLRNQPFEWPGRFAAIFRCRRCSSGSARRPCRSRAPS